MYLHKIPPTPSCIVQVVIQAWNSTVIMDDIQWAPWHAEELAGIGELTEETIKSSETIVCRIYHLHRTDSIDAARHLLFSKTRKPAAMAPTSDAVRFHLRIVHYQAMIWRNAHCPTPELPAPSEMGWRLGGSGRQLVRMSLSPTSDSCLEMVDCSRRKQCNTRRCTWQKSGLRCTTMCACQHQTDDQTACMNRHSWKLIMMTESCSGRNAYPKQVTRIVMGRGLVEFGIPYLC